MTSSAPLPFKLTVEYYAADVLCGHVDSVSTEESARLVPFLRPVGCADKRLRSGIHEEISLNWAISLEWKP
jgi:hypothetical protein